MEPNADGSAGFRDYMLERGRQGEQAMEGLVNELRCCSERFVFYFMFFPHYTVSRN